MTGKTIAEHEILRQELGRILSSREFSRAEYLCRFLRCCVEQTVSGNVSQLKEFWLGRSVFQRDKEFNPSADPIVRVQARRLRQKLERYYSDEGRGSPVRIVLPVGTYVPQLLTRDQIAVPPPAAPRKKLSLAVLPFASSDENGGAATYAELLTDELIHHMVESGKFQVVSRLSSLRFRNSSDDVRTIGKALNADLLIEGRVRGTVPTPCISVQLTDAVSGYHLWSVSFDGANSTLDRNPGDIARRIAAILDNESPAVRKTPLPRL